MNNKSEIKQVASERCWCGSFSYVVLIKDSRRDFEIRRCIKCGLARTFPVPDSSEKRYRQYSMEAYKRNEKILKGFMRQILNLITKYKPNGNFLEVGSGAGYLLEMASLKFKTFGVEISQEGVNLARKKKCGTIKNCSLKQANFPADFFDVIVLNHTLEHIVDLKGFFAELKRVIDKNGILVLGVPNFGGFFAKLRKNKWPGLQPKEHIWQFEPETLQKVLDSFGFTTLCLKRKASHNRSSIFNRRSFSIKQSILKILNWVSGFLGQGDNLLLVAKLKR